MAETTAAAAASDKRHLYNQSWEEQMNEASMKTFLRVASQTVQHFVSKSHITLLETSSNEEADIILVPHFQYPHTDEEDDEEKEMSDSDSSCSSSCSSSSHDRSSRTAIHDDTKKRTRRNHSSSPFSSKLEGDPSNKSKKHKTIFQHPPASTLSSCFSLHLSLSKPFYLQQHNIQSFISDLTQQVQTLWKEIQPQNHPFILSFPITEDDDDDSIFKNTMILCNEEQTRAFLTVSLMEEEEDESLHLLIRTIMDPIMIKYGLPTYRFDGKKQNSKEEEDSTLIDHGGLKLHVSIASMIGRNLITSLVEESEHENTNTTALTTHVDIQKSTFYSNNDKDKNMSIVSFFPRHVVCVLGNHLTFIIPLP